MGERLAVCFKAAGEKNIREGDNAEILRATGIVVGNPAEAFRARYTSGTNGDFRVLDQPRPWREVAELAGISERTAQRRVGEAFEIMRAAVAR